MKILFEALKGIGKSILVFTVFIFLILVSIFVGIRDFFKRGD